MTVKPHDFAKYKTKKKTKTEQRYRVNHPEPCAIEFHKHIKQFVARKKIKTKETKKRKQKEQKIRKKHMIKVNFKIFFLFNEFNALNWIICLHWSNHSCSIYITEHSYPSKKKKKFHSLISKLYSNYNPWKKKFFFPLSHSLLSIPFF